MIISPWTCRHFTIICCWTCGKPLGTHSWQQVQEISSFHTIYMLTEERSGRRSWKGATGGSCDLPWFTYFSDQEILYGWEWLMADVSKILCPFFPGCERLCWRLKSSDLECLGADIRSRRWRSHRFGMTYGAKWSGSGQPCTYRLYCIWCTVLLIHTHIYINIYIYIYIVS